MASTIYDIAAKAGVSIATVSRVFNQSTNVSQKTRNKVLKVAESVGYHPQAYAQGLASKKAKYYNGSRTGYFELFLYGNIGGYSR